MLSLDADLVSRLIAEQFPPWSHLPVREVEVPGWDNASFRLGDDLVVRFPRNAECVDQVRKEDRWLAILGPQLPLRVPDPIALGKPSATYPWPWAVRRWIAGEIALPARIGDPAAFAVALAGFLRALQGIPSEGGPPAGPQSFHRGGSLDVYDRETRDSIGRLEARPDRDRALQVWDEAVATRWDRAPLWVHGDIAPGNLLVRNGKLVAVIDFGQLAIGDPACDMVIAWSLLSGESRRAFRAALAPDDASWKRARGWALWKSLISATGYRPTNAIEAA